MSKDILKQYDRNWQLYNSFSKKIKELIQEILKGKGASIHSVTDRVKDRESLARKLSRPEGNYTALTDVTDVCGVRIITYFEDDVDKIAKVIEKEFKIDKDNSIDKRKLLDPDRFGYLSLHHIVSLHDKRCGLAEYQKFSGLKAEIQTRTILQHAWAEIEHDLGYKSKLEVPNLIRRKFSRLASLLELADEGFIALRNELANYETSVPERIEHTPQEVSIDKASLIAFVSNSETAKKLDNYIASLAKATLHLNLESIARNAQKLQYFSINTIAQLQSELLQYAPEIERFAKQWFERPRSETGHGKIEKVNVALHRSCAQK